MKKLFISICSVALLAGCANNAGTAEATPEPTAEATAEATATPEATPEAKAEGGLRVGVGSSTSISASEAADADTDGSVQFNTTYAGIVLDADDVIKYLYLDVAQNTVKFGVDGAITSDPEAATPTKREKGEAYNMKGASAIGLEWDEQAKGFEEWAVGQKLADVLAVPTEKQDNGHVVTTNEDLLTTTTISIDEWIKAIKAAADNAVEAGEFAEVGTGSVTSLSISAAENADTDGSIQANTTYAVVAVDGSGKIVKVMSDVAQNTVKFTNEGALAGDAAPAPTKKEKGEAYNMKGASPIGKEWDEQNEGFEAWAVGKTVAEIAASPTEAQDNGHIVSTDADLLTTTTISIDAHLKAVEAAGNALEAVK